MMNEDHDPYSPLEIPNEYLCPITLELMEEPVVAADGHTYERQAIREWLDRGNRRSPMTNERFAHITLTPNHTLRSLIRAFREKLPEVQRQRTSEADRQMALRIRIEELEAGLRKRERQLTASKAGSATQPEDVEHEDPQQLLETSNDLRRQIVALRRHNRRLQKENAKLRRKQKASSEENPAKTEKGKEKTDAGKRPTPRTTSAATTTATAEQGPALPRIDVAQGASAVTGLFAPRVRDEVRGEPRIVDPQDPQMVILNNIRTHGRGNANERFTYFYDDYEEVYDFSSTDTRRDYGFELPSFTENHDHAEFQILSLAISEGYDEIVRDLLERGADPNLPNEAIEHFSEEVDAFDGFGSVGTSSYEEREVINFPLHVAVEGNYAGIVGLLLDHGADPSLRDENRQTPLDLARRNNNQDIINLLTNHLAPRPNPQ